MVGALPRLRYEFASIVVYDPVAQHRNATRMALFSLGFSKVSACDTLDSLNRSIKTTPPDLILCEADNGGGELCDLIRTVRQGSGGHTNPFLTIIVTAWEKSQSLVHDVVNSGADDLVLRPFSTSILKARIDTHIERRKGFVVTYDYVGPDRRKDTRPASGELFHPPNSLKMKTMDGLTMPEANFRLQQELRRAKDTLASEKLMREVFRICVLWRMLQDDDPGETVAHLAGLRDLIQSVTRRCRARELELALPWCETIHAAVEGLHFGVDRNASLHLLGQGALTLNEMVQPQRSRSAHMQAIEETVATIRSRGPARNPEADGAEASEDPDASDVAIAG
jgi:Response regulator containing a CheY-like receiver domain and a GGDEF domain